MASEQNSGVDDRLVEVGSRLDRLESRLDRVESMAADTDEPGEEVEDLRIALNGLRREHRELKETVEESVLDYMAEEKEVMQELDRKIEDLGDLVREVTANRNRIAELKNEVGEKADVDELRERIAAVEEEIEETGEESREEDEELMDRVRTIETRLDLIAERMD